MWLFRKLKQGSGRSEQTRCKAQCNMCQWGRLKSRSNLCKTMRSVSQSWPRGHGEVCHLSTESQCLSQLSKVYGAREGVNKGWVAGYSELWGGWGAMGQWLYSSSSEGRVVGQYEMLILKPKGQHSDWAPRGSEWGGGEWVSTLVLLITKFFFSFWGYPLSELAEAFLLYDLT